MEWREDEDSEAFLRQFQPRKPSAPPYQSERRVSWLRRYAVAAVIVLVVRRCVVRVATEGSGESSNRRRIQARKNCIFYIRRG